MKDSVRKQIFRLTGIVIIVVLGLQLLLFSLYEVIEFNLDNPNISKEEFFQDPEVRAWASHELEEIGVLATIGLITAPVLLLLCGYIIRRTLRPLESLSSQVADINEGTQAKRIQPYGRDDEIGELVTALNKAFDGHHQALDKLSRFSANASHQLRTPLTVIQTSGEVALMRERSSEEYREIIADILDETSLLLRVVEQQLLLARSDTLSPIHDASNHDMAKIIEQQLDILQPLINERPIETMINMSGGEALCNDILIGQAINNLISNSLNAMETGGTLSITLKQDSNELVIDILDDGPGLPAGLDLNNIDPLVDSMPSEKGHGLGLTIANGIIMAHHGSLTLQNRDEGGAHAQIRLPLA